jgi:hypothetical protein
MADWFAQNAPQAAPPPSAAGDWFAQNAPPGVPRPPLPDALKPNKDPFNGARVLGAPVLPADAIVPAAVAAGLSKIDEWTGMGHPTIAGKPVQGAPVIPRPAPGQAGDGLPSGSLPKPGSSIAKSVAQDISDVGRAAADPDVLRAIAKVLPKGPAALDAYDKYAAVKAKIEALRRASGPPEVLRDQNSPAWAAGPGPAPQKAVEFEPTPATSLPSGRVPGSLANAPAEPVPVQPPSRPAPAWKNGPGSQPGAPEFQPVPAQVLPSGRAAGGPAHAASLPEATSAAPTATDPALLDGLSKALAKKPFNKLSSDEQQAVRVIAERGAPKVTEVPVRSHAPATLAEQLREEILKDPNVTPEQIAEPVTEMPNPDGAKYEAAARDAKSLKLAQALHGAGISSADASGLMNESDWKTAAQAVGATRPKSGSWMGSATAEQALFHLRKLEQAKVQ